MDEQEPATVERVTDVVAKWPQVISTLRYLVEFKHVENEIEEQYVEDTIEGLVDLNREMCDLTRIIIESEDKLVKANMMQTCKAGEFSATTWHGLCLSVTQSFLGNIWYGIRDEFSRHEVVAEKNNKTSKLKNFDAQLCRDHFKIVKSSILAFQKFDEDGLSCSVKREGILTFQRSQDKNWGIEKPEPVPNSLIDANGGRQIAPLPDDSPAVVSSLAVDQVPRDDSGETYNTRQLLALLLYAHHCAKNDSTVITNACAAGLLGVKTGTVSKAIKKIFGGQKEYKLHVKNDFEGLEKKLREHLPDEHKLDPSAFVARFKPE
jgi:hypothetical protein